MRLEEDMYVRTNGGNIGKIESFVSSLQNDFIKTPYEEYILKKDIKKASFNIIDLIQEGDYVNDEKVIYIDDLEGCMREYHVEGENPEKDCGHWNEEIKSIVTKEQLEQIKYEVK